jgi:hypothetical protein
MFVLANGLPASLGVGREPNPIWSFLEESLEKVLRKALVSVVSGILLAEKTETSQSTAVPRSPGSCVRDAEKTLTAAPGQEILPGERRKTATSRRLDQ